MTRTADPIATALRLAKLYRETPVLVCGTDASSPVQYVCWHTGVVRESGRQFADFRCQTLDMIRWASREWGGAEVVIVVSRYWDNDASEWRTHTARYTKR